MALSATELNALLEARVRDLAGRRAPTSLQGHLHRTRDERSILMRCLGLEPLPQIDELNAAVTGTVQRDGYRIEKIRFESRKDFLVTAHLYLPESEKPSPVILRPHGHWSGKKSEPVVQASAIGLALAGYAVMVIDSPGAFGEPNGLNEREAQGPHMDPWLCMGTPMIGLYVWDLMRAVDYLKERSDVDVSRIGITGESGGGLAAMYSFAADERIACAAPVCYASSLETEPNNGCLCNHIPGVLDLGDRSDVLALRAPAPVLVVGATDDPEFPPAGTQKTYDKLRSIYRLYDRESNARVEIVEAKHDYNRRMRESVLAFFDEHLKGVPRRSYTSELRPLTDGAHNPYPTNTVPREDSELLVLPEGPHASRTMRQLLEDSLRAPTPYPYDARARLAPWGKYGRLETGLQGPKLFLNDKELVLDQIEGRHCIYLGLSVCEFYAQVLHLALPGGVEGWEKSTLGPSGDVMTALIGSMKTLMHATNPAVQITEIHADGPLSSLVAAFFRTLRPAVTISVSHPWDSWQALYDSGIPALTQPLARYLQWIA